MPAWLSEGIAMYASGDKRAGDAGALLSGATAAGHVQAGRRPRTCSRSRSSRSRPRSTACRRIPLTFAYSYAAAAAFTIAEKHGGAKALLQLYSAFNSEKIEGAAGRKLTDKVVRKTLKTSLKLARGRHRRVRAGQQLSVGGRCTPLACSGAMPELPEVETIRRHLAPHVEGRVLEAVDVLDERWCRPLAPEELAHAVHGRRSNGSRAAASTSCGSSPTTSTCSCTCA